MSKSKRHWELTTAECLDPASYNWLHCFSTKKFCPQWWSWNGSLLVVRECRPYHWTNFVSTWVTWWPWKLMLSVSCLDDLIMQNSVLQKNSHWHMRRLKEEIPWSALGALLALRPLPLIWPIGLNFETSLEPPPSQIQLNKGLILKKGLKYGTRYS